MKILSSSLNTMLIVDKHCSDICCDEFPVPQIDYKIRKYKNSELNSFIRNQYGERLAKLEAIKNAFCLHFVSCLLHTKYLQKFEIFEFFISESSAVTCAR